MESPDKPAASPGETSWTEQSRALSSEPAARFRLACGHLPQKQAFREAAVALRALIREHCDSRSRVEGYLDVLYRFAALESLVYPSADDRSVDAGDEDEVEMGPTERWSQVADVRVPYAEVGCGGLSLLTKTDRALMAQLWGKPQGSMTPADWLKEHGPDPDPSTVGEGPAPEQSSPPQIEIAEPAEDRQGAEAALAGGQEPKPEPPGAVSPQGVPDPDPVADMGGQDQEEVAADAVFRLMERERRGEESARSGFKLRRWASVLLSRLGV